MRRFSALLLSVTALLGVSRAQSCLEGGELQYVGLATVGQAGLLDLEVVGAPLEGQPFGFQVTSARSFAAGALMVSLKASPTFLPKFGATLYPGSRRKLLPFALDGDGESGLLAYQNPVSAAMCGRAFVAQAVVLDPAAMGGRSFSKAVEYVFGGPAAGHLFPSAAFPLGGSPDELAVGDLTGDGIQDVVAIVEGLNFEVHSGNGDGTFVQADAFSMGSAYSSPRIVDVNDDQVPDLVAITSWAVTTFLGTGGGALAAPVDTVTACTQCSGSSIALGDFDEDGLPELVVSNRDLDELWIYPGIGDGSFGPPSVIAVGSRPEGAVVANLDGDAHLDLVVANHWSGDVTVLLGTGTGSFAPATSYPAGAQPARLVVAQLNGDSIPDLVVHDVASDEVVAMIGAGGGAFGPPILTPTIVKPEGLCAGDWDGDGFADLALPSNYTSDDVVALQRGAGDGTFGAPASYRVGGRPVGCAAADLDEDGVPDVVTINEWSEDFSVLLGSGDGTFPTNSSYTGGKNPVSVTVADLNGDQILDYATANYTSHNVAMRTGVGDGTFAPVQFEKFGANLAFIASADLNGDRVVDLVVAEGGFGPADVWVLLGTGGGSFAAPQSYPSGSDLQGVTICDLDGDQVPDLAVPADAGAVVFTGIGDGSFAPGVTYPAGLFPRAIACGDFDGDDLVDLAVANNFDQGVELLSGAPGGVFVPSATLPIPGRLDSILAEDLDGDGVLDLLTGDDDVVVLAGVGDGTFLAPVTYPAGKLFRLVGLADLDRDGITDLVVTNSYDMFSILPGTGDGGFRPRLGFSARGPVGVALGDLDGDAMPDLVLANGTDDRCTIVLNRRLR